MLDALPRFGQWADTVREFETPYGTIGYRQAAILWVLRYELLPAHEMTPTGFATFFGVQPSVVTRALAKLEQSGFVERSIDAQDTRVSRIAMTTSGRAISVFVERIYVDDLLAALEPISEDEVARLHQAIETLDEIAGRLDLLRIGRSKRTSPPS
jgi:DNA-binding MarR family transcriptional regulator